MKKVLIISYYWPPSGGSGVRRWLNFSNLFHDYNWQPIILKPKNADYPAIDLSLNKSIHPDTIVLECPIIEPFKIYSKFLGKKGNIVKPGVLYHNEKPNFRENFSVWVRGNFFVPDARMFWIKPAIRRLKEYLKENEIDLIVSTGPPHSTHIIAHKISKKFDIPWIADFRDPWTKIDFFHKLKLNKLALKRHQRLERMVLTDSTMQTTVSWSWGDDFKTLGAKNVQVITNGFDPENYSSEPSDLDSNFTITHLGSMNDDRNHPEFWRAIHELINENEEFKNKITIQLIGDNVPSVIQEIENNGLKEYCQIVPFLTHPEAMKTIASSRVLYLPLNNTPHVEGIVPGKIFEYLAVKRPVFAIGPTNGDSARILSTASNGIICNFGDFVKIKESILLLFSNYKASSDIIVSDNFKIFSRIELAKQMIGFMEVITSK
jgi:glycosyltransferase involved in cell wall biosynthesis